MTGIGMLGYLATSRGGVDAFGKPLGTDFICFWTASKLALSGQPASAYVPKLHAAAQLTLFPNAYKGYTAFFYPPTFLLVCLPLALLPYVASLAVWLAASFLALCTALRRLLPQRWAILPIAAFPGVLANVGHGQNAFVTTACLGWSVVLCRRRPFIAGLFLGLLVIKPQLLLAAPIGLLAGRRWTIIAGGLTSGLLLAALSWLAFGGDAWRGFLVNARLARVTLEQGLVEPYKMQSVFAATRLLHAGLWSAYAVQGLIAVAVCVVLIGINRRRPGVAAELVILLPANLLCTPVIMDYDLMCLSVPIAWVAMQAQRTGWFAWEKSVLLAAYMSPMLARSVAINTGISIAPVIVAFTLLVVARRISISRDIAPSRESGASGSSGRGNRTPPVQVPVVQRRSPWPFIVTVV